MSTTDLKTYHGSCHCQAFTFTISIAPLQAANSCDCSLCYKTGALWTTPANPEDLYVKQGDWDLLAQYTPSNSQQIYYFCSACGTSLVVRQTSEGEGTEDRINIRALHDVNVFDIEDSKANCGSSITSQSWTPATFNGQSPTGGPENGQIYTGSCHCGAVTLAVNVEDLATGNIEIKEDNCSICQRNANTSIYPHKSQVSIATTNTTDLTEYTFGRKFTGHRFCRTCGVPIYMHVYGPPKEMFERLPLHRQQALRPQFELRPVRVRVLDGVDVNGLKVTRDDVGQSGYVVKSDGD